MDNTRYNKILDMAKKSDKIHLTNNNSKCGKACLCLSLPCCVCSDNLPCKKYCYCNKGRQQTTKVLQAYYRNLLLYQKDSKSFFNQLDIAIKYNGLPLFRFFDSGDIVDYNFFVECIKVIKKNKQVKFLMFTKKYDIVNKYLDNGNKLPNNLILRYSYLDKNFIVDNKHNLPKAYINYKDKSINPTFIGNKFYKCNCKLTCSQCKKCFNKDLTIIFDQH